jgi:hypothetical protein
MTLSTKLDGANKERSVRDWRELFLRRRAARSDPRARFVLGGSVTLLKVGTGQVALLWRIN